MAIEKEYGEFVPTCDICGKTLPPVETFEDARAAMRKAGWTTFKVGDNWENLCVVCQEED
jgi:hypothetical protein